MYFLPLGFDLHEWEEEEEEGLRCSWVTFLLKTFLGTKKCMCT